MPPATVLPADLSDQVSRALREDVGTGDVTAALIAADAVSHARLLCRDEAIVCGAAWLDETFRQLDPQIKVTWHTHDGAHVARDTVLCEIAGNARAMLTGERTALNFVQ